MTKSNRQINKEDSMMDNTPDSPAVIAYRLGQVEAAVKDGFVKHDKRLTELVSNFASTSDVTSLAVRVASLESDRKWLVRLVIGSVVFAVLALIGVGFKLNT
jgi:hypothetical protein